jgi:hypothetical protein
MTAEIVSLDTYRRRHGPGQKSRTGILALGEPPFVPVIDGTVSLVDLYNFARLARDYEKEIQL